MQKVKFSEVAEKWDNLPYTSYSYDTYISTPFYHFPTGTSIFEVTRYIEKTFHASLLYAYADVSYFNKVKDNEGLI